MHPFVLKWRTTNFSFYKILHFFKNKNSALLFININSNLARISSGKFSPSCAQPLFSEKFISNRPQWLRLSTLRAFPYFSPPPNGLSFLTRQAKLSFLFPSLFCASVSLEVEKNWSKYQLFWIFPLLHSFWAFKSSILLCTDTFSCLCSKQEAVFQNVF